jgi:hypothetical protein
MLVAREKSGSRHRKSGRSPELLIGNSTKLTSCVLGGLIISTRNDDVRSFVSSVISRLLEVLFSSTTVSLVFLA